MGRGHQARVAETKFIILRPEEKSILFELCRELSSYRKAGRRADLVLRLGLHGLSPSEICGLRHEDFDGECMMIQRQVNRFGGKAQVRETLKTANRKDIVPIDDPRLKMILASKHAGFVLATENGRHLEPTKIRRLLEGLVPDWNIRRLPGGKKQIVTERSANSTPTSFATPTRWISSIAWWTSVRRRS